MRYCALIGKGEALERAFASLSLESGSAEKPVADKVAGLDGEDISKTQQSHRELSIIIEAMRKVREAIVASGRKDTFARDAYIFIIRATILTKNMASYHPALLHLLRNLHSASPLSASELHEFIGYHLLDLACRQGNLESAFEARNRYHYRDRKIDMLLKALVHDNWYTFWKVEKSVTGYQKQLTAFAADEVRSHALKCLGRSYLTVEKAYAERVAARSWEDLKIKNNVGWELNGEVITLRKVRGK